MRMRRAGIIGRFVGLVGLWFVGIPGSVAGEAEAPSGVVTGPSSDVPSQFIEKAKLDYAERVVMIPMRDGVRLNTVILIPKRVQSAPIILTRTPYDAVASVQRFDLFVESGYIRVFQDIRGKYGSDGNYVVTRPVRGPLNTTGVDHPTDTWDTIEWLVTHVPESNGKVGMIGLSYEGYLTAEGLLEPHPALRAAVPESPFINGWMGDDWFHYGAFRNNMLGYIHMQTRQRGAGEVTPHDYYDEYEELLRAGSVGDYARACGLDQLPWVIRTMAHPAYDAYWQDQDVARLLSASPSSVPTLWVQGLWDQEDMWGANHAWLALRRAGHIDNNWLVLGPWSHTQVTESGESLGPLHWRGDTAEQFRREIMLPFFDHYLRDGPRPALSRVTVYNTGNNHWEKFEDWPTACEEGCSHRLTPLYTGAGFRLSFEAPSDSRAAGDTYISDPEKPVPFLPRPNRDPYVKSSADYGAQSDYGPWSRWLVTDQRFVDGRPDVLSYETPVLTESIHVQGVPVADIRATSSGSDGDFVVKLIDVYPALVPQDPPMGGYELPISLDIFRGRYRDSFEHPTPIPPGVAQRYHFALPNVNHVFLPGHRIMVQIQSSLFPLYDRNPQTFVSNIFNAKPSDYRKAQITILHAKGEATAVWLPVVP